MSLYACPECGTPGLIVDALALTRLGADGTAQEVGQPVWDPKDYAFCASSAPCASSGTYYVRDFETTWGT